MQAHDNPPGPRGGVNIRARLECAVPSHHALPGAPRPVPSPRAAPRSAGAPLLVAEALAARRGQVSLWRDLSFRVAAGEALLVRGRNGVGKTTLLRIAAGLTAPDGGSLSWRGERLRPFARALRRDVLYLADAPTLRDELTAAENLASLASLAGLAADRAAVTAALEALGLARRASLPARARSQGQRRRAQLALLPLGERPLWVLDEPANALDAEGVARFEALLAAHLARGGLALVATHLDIAAARGAALELA